MINFLLHRDKKKSISAYLSVMQWNKRIPLPYRNKHNRNSLAVNWYVLKIVSNIIAWLHVFPYTTYFKILRNQYLLKIETDCWWLSIFQCIWAHNFNIYRHICCCFHLWFTKHLQTIFDAQLLHIEPIKFCKSTFY